MSSRNVPARRTAPVLPAIEPLDRRLLLSGISTVDKTIVVSGSEGADWLEVEFDFEKDRLVVFGLNPKDHYKPTKVPLAHRRIIVNAGGGNDQVWVGSKHYERNLDERFRVTVRGGDGDDHLAAWHVRSTIFGDEGDDFLVGNYGKFRLKGNAGNDVLNGTWSDRNYINGGAGADEIRLFPTYNNPANDSDTIVGDAADTWTLRYVGDAIADYDGDQGETIIKAAGVEPEEKRTIFRGDATR